MFQIMISAKTAEDFAAKVSDLAAQFGAAEQQEAPAKRTRKAKAEPVSEVKAEESVAAEEPVKPAEPEAKAEPEQKAEPEAKPEAAVLSGDALKKAIDELRGWVISEYLNTAYSGPQERADAFKAICGHFNLAKFGDLSGDQIDAMRAHVQSRIEKAAGA